jgi:hypothetical protein
MMLWQRVYWLQFDKKSMIAEETMIRKVKKTINNIGMYNNFANEYPKR